MVSILLGNLLIGLRLKLGRDEVMSMSSCTKCEDIIDTDFQSEVNKFGDSICDRCFEEVVTECDICGEMKDCYSISLFGIDTTVCDDCLMKEERECLVKSKR